MKLAISGNWEREGVVERERERGERERRKKHSYDQAKTKQNKTITSALVPTFTPTSPHLGANVVSDHLLDHHVGERLEVLDELLVLVIASFLLHEQLEERSLLPADPRHVCRLFGHPEQQP